jgi:hypothetical protein
MRALLSVALLSLAATANAGNLERLDQVDLIELELKTSRALLVVLLEEDKVNTRPAMKALFKKVNNYLDFVASGQRQRRRSKRERDVSSKDRGLWPKRCHLGRNAKPCRAQARRPESWSRG